MIAIAVAVRVGVREREWCRSGLGVSRVVKPSKSLELAGRPGTCDLQAQSGSGSWLLYLLETRGEKDFARWTKSGGVGWSDRAVTKEMKSAWLVLACSVAESRRSFTAYFLPCPLPLLPCTPFRSLEGSWLLLATGPGSGRAGSAQLLIWATSTVSNFLGNA